MCNSDHGGLVRIKSPWCNYNFLQGWPYYKHICLPIIMTPYEGYDGSGALRILFWGWVHLKNIIADIIMATIMSFVRDKMAVAQLEFCPEGELIMNIYMRQ